MKWLLYHYVYSCVVVYQYQVKEVVKMLCIHNFVTYMYTGMYICMHMYTDTNSHTHIQYYAYTIIVLDVYHIRPN